VCFNVCWNDGTALPHPANNIAYLILYYFKQHIINICIIIIIHAVLYYVEYTINLAGAATFNFSYKNDQTENL